MRFARFASSYSFAALIGRLVFRARARFPQLAAELIRKLWEARMRAKNLMQFTAAIPPTQRGRRLARYMIRCPFAIEKMRYDKKSGSVMYRSKLCASTAITPIVRGARPSCRKRFTARGRAEDLLTEPYLT